MLKIQRRDSIMQYKIFCDDYILYDSQLNEFQVGSPVLKQELNTANELTFTIYPNHPYFNNISKLSSIVRVYRNDKLLFKGRVINSELGFYNEKKITCEGVLAFFTWQRYSPIRFPKWWQVFRFRLWACINQIISRISRFERKLRVSLGY